MGKKEKSCSQGRIGKVELELDISYSNHPGGFEEEEKILIVEKEQRKLLLMRQEEETWRQKSRLNWLAHVIEIQNSFMLMLILGNISMQFGRFPRQKVYKRKQLVFSKISSWLNLTLLFLINLQS